MIDTHYFWFIVLFLSIGTLSIRFSFIALSSKFKISEQLKEIFSFIPAVVIPALIAPMVFFHEGQVNWALEKERFLILILATVVCYLTKSMIGTILFGLITLFLATQF